MTGHRIDLPEMPTGSKFTGEYIKGGVKIRFKQSTHRKKCDKQPISGNKYLCTSPVSMTDGSIAFTKGIEYTSINTNCVTNNYGNSNHIMGHPYFGKHFRNA